MAFSLPIEKGQVHKVCELCETVIKINWKCINCNLLMCNKCKERVHSKIKSAEQHKIIDIKDVGKHSEELDFGNIKCEDHGQTCVMFCKSCDQLVCPQCMAGVHNGHRFVQIIEGYKIKIEKAKEIKKQIKNCIEELNNGGSKIKSLRKDENSKYTETRNLIQAQNAALKREVDKYTEKLIKQLDQKWTTLQNSMDKEELKITAMKTRKEDQNTKAEAIINSKDADQVFKESKIMEKLIKEAMEPVNLLFTTMPMFSPGEITEYKFGSLQDVPTDLLLNINQQFITDETKVFDLTSCPDDSLWISDGNVLQNVKPEGSNLNVISNFNIETTGMALTPTNDLLLITEDASRLQQISGSSGQVTDSVYSVDPFFLTAVHVTSDYKVMVGAGYYDGEVVIRMNKEGKHEKTYEHDRNKQPIFTGVTHITTTTNGTMFVVDVLSDGASGRIVVLGQDGDVINTYTGHPKINSDVKPFNPVFAIRTPSDNIIVTDTDTSTLHILNRVGHLITFYNTENIGILRPCSLSFTNSGQLYIGCSSPKDSTDNAKLYELDRSQILVPVSEH